jgi:hypothetical protein
MRDFHGAGPKNGFFEVGTLCATGANYAESRMSGSRTLIKTAAGRTQLMKINRSLVIAGIASALCWAVTPGLAQDNPRPQRRNFDPAQMRERIMERYKEQLEITEDAEWKAIQPLVQNVMDARMATMSGMGRGMFGPPRRTSDNGDQTTRRGPFGQDPSPESEALQKAIDAKASNAELKAAIAKFTEYRKAKEAELEKAQAGLRKVLTVRQEAIATANGLL